MILLVNRQQVQDQIISNLLSTDALLPEDEEHYRKVLDSASVDELMSVLLESHTLRELLECQTEVTPLVPIKEICLN